MNVNKLHHVMSAVSGAPRFLERPHDHPEHSLPARPLNHFPRALTASAQACCSCPAPLLRLALDPPLQEDVGSQAFHTPAIRQRAFGVQA